jgi:hypothetical protein
MNIYLVEDHHMCGANRAVIVAKDEAQAVKMFEEDFNEVGRGKAKQIGTSTLKKAQIIISEEDY